MAWDKLGHRPDLLLADRHGILHPRRLGVTSHFGLLVDIPAIGVAKRRLCGKFAPVVEAQGALAATDGHGEQLAWVWRSKLRCNPLFIFTGHNRVGLLSALHCTQLCMRGYRRSKPTRLADAVGSNRTACQRWQQALGGGLRLIVKSGV